MNLKGRDLMKKKSILPLVTVTMLATALLGGCANKTESTTTSEATPTEAVKEGNSYAGQTISGEVTEIDGDTISMTPEGEEDDISFTVNDDVEITREGMGQPPEMSGDDSSSTPPEMPDGEAPSGNAPGGDMATSTDASLTDIQVGDTIQVTFDDDGTITAIVISNGNAGGGAPGQPGDGNSGGVESYDAVSEYTTDADGAAGAFAYGDGTVYISDSTIKTTGNTAGGIHAAGGGTLYAWDLDVETDGNSSAAIRSDRGGGTMVVDGGTYTSNGTGSPAVYSTADIAVSGATLTANGSEVVCIEGLNSLRLFDTDLTGNMSDDSQNDCTWNVILYQSMSGDSEVGNSTFEMDCGSLTAKNGGMFYTTNTESTFILNDVDITYADDNDFFLRCTGNNNQRGWGTSGSNGADCEFTAIDQDMEGDVIWDSISQLDFYMTDESTLTGAITDDETYAGNGGDGYCNVYIEKGSTWTVTGDSYSTSVDTSDAESTTSFSDYAVTQP